LLQKVCPISQVVDDNKPYCIKGLVKRLEFERVRAFENDFEGKYNNDQPIYNEHDELEIEDPTGKLKLYIPKDAVKFPFSDYLNQTDIPSGVCLVISGKFRKRINKFRTEQVYLPSLPPQSNFLPNYVENGVPFENKRILVASEPSR
jgi:hypothetical protein